MNGTRICHCPIDGCSGHVVERDVRGHREYCCNRCMRSLSMSAILHAHGALTAKWFDAVAELEDRYREHLRVKLTAEQCRHVAELLRGGLSMSSCAAGDMGPGGLEP